jgi:pseudouridine synthase
LQQWRSGVPLDGQPSQPVALRLLERDGEAALLELQMGEGRNRQIRRMCEAVGHPVSKLKRIRIGPITDPKIRPGEFRDLDEQEIASLKRAASRTPAPRAPRSPRRA